MGNHTAIKSADNADNRDKGITNFYNWTRPSSDTKGKHKQRSLDRSDPKVIDVPLGEVTYVCFISLFFVSSRELTTSWVRPTMLLTGKR